MSLEGGLVGVGGCQCVGSHIQASYRGALGHTAVWGALGHMGHPNIWGHLNIWGHQNVWDIQMYRGHLNIWGASNCMGGI